MKVSKCEPSEGWYRGLAGTEAGFDQVCGRGWCKVSGDWFSEFPATFQLCDLDPAPFLSQPRFLCQMRMERTSQVSWKSIVSSGVRMFGTRCRTGGRAWLLSGPLDHHQRLFPFLETRAHLPGAALIPQHTLSPGSSWYGGKGLAERVRAEQVPPTSDSLDKSQTPEQAALVQFLSV